MVALPLARNTEVELYWLVPPYSRACRGGGEAGRGGGGASVIDVRPLPDYQNQQQRHKKVTRDHAPITSQYRAM